MTPTGMEEVLALESAIRAFLKTGKSEEASQLLAQPWRGSGTRLAALKDVVGRLIR